MPRKNRAEFNCAGCGVNTSDLNEYYMLNDDVWYLVFSSERGMLCIGCVEERLGRKLNALDFNGSYLNWGRGFPKSQRLAERLGLIYEGAA